MEDISLQTKLEFCISLGEVEEVRSHLMVGFGRKYLSKENFEFLDKEYEGLGVGINFYIQEIGKQKHNHST